jgi:hypothetical protein
MSKARELIEKYVAKSPDEQRFWDKHETEVFDPMEIRKNVIDPSLENVGVINRKKERHGYNSADSKAAYENVVIQWRDIQSVLNEADLDEDTRDTIYAGLAENALDLNESFYDNISEEVINKVYESASDEERELLDEILASDEGHEDVLNALFEEDLSDEEIDEYDALAGDFEDERLED